MSDFVELEKYGLEKYHVGALEMLRSQPIASVPTGICSPWAMVKLRRLGLIEESGIPGFWAITKHGQDVDIGAITKKQATRKIVYYDQKPDTSVARQLLEAASTIEAKKPGQTIFGKVIRASTMEFLSGKSSFKKFVFFAYPEGYPLKHIAWAMRESGIRPNWGEPDVQTARAYLGMPATRFAYKPKITAQQKADLELRALLREEGMQDWEIDEYYATRADGRLVA